jgi:class 3 adenylate cyclase/tetratricopeptide (TPR) repeat protein
MRCPHCDQENLPDSLFCSECGHKLERFCPRCQADNRPTSKFCRKCGIALQESKGTRENEETGKRIEGQRGEVPVDGQGRETNPRVYTPKHLIERILAEQVGLENRGAPAGERKTITALFADIKGSMALIEDLDPEEARRVIDPMLQLMMDAVHRYEGYVAQALGDGIFALFGAPIAHEDHSQRALYAALRMQEESHRYAEVLRREHGVNVQIRIGVNTGEVVVRSIRKEDLHTDYVPVGHSTSLAARLEHLATPGTTVVSAATYALTEGYFEFKALGAAQIKGVSEPVQIYEVLGTGPLRTRLQVAVKRGLVHFVGRQQEMEQLRQALNRTRSGHGQIVSVVGEPGVGKSRLFHEFLEAYGDRRVPSLQRDCLVLETFAVSHGKGYPYLPLLELLRRYFYIVPRDDERGRRERITGKVLTLDRSLEDTLPYVFALLGVAEPSSPLPDMDPQLRQQRTVEAIKRLLGRESLNQPVILLFEDLHWLDTETQVFLSVLAESIASARILLLVNYRPEYQHAWGSKTYYTQLRLDPLGQEEAEELLATLLEEARKTARAASRDLHAPGAEVDTPYVPVPVNLTALKQFILDKTQGNPFFIEELVQALFDQGVLVRNGGVSLVTPLSEIRMPLTIQGVLAARIDRLTAAEKALLQTLAVLGKEFSFGLVKRVVNDPEEDVRGVLAHLQAAEFIYEQPMLPEPQYAFKHALTREVAYGSLLLESRKVLHECAAHAIEDAYGNRLESYYGDLARHYDLSGNTAKAVEYLRRAGEQAVQRSAYTEAINHLTSALELLKNLPDTSERARQELTLQLALGNPLIATRGYAAPEVEQVYSRTWDLYQQVGQMPQLFFVLFGLWRFHLVRGRYTTAHELATQFMGLAQASKDPALLLPANFALGFSLFRLGELASAREHLERGIALYHSQEYDRDQEHAFPYGQDTGVTSLSYAAWILWYLGYPDQALKRSQEALALAYERAHPFTLAFALHFSAALHRMRREGPAAQQRAEEELALSSGHGFPYFVAGSTFLLGWALAEQGQADEGITLMRQGLGAHRAAGTVQVGQLLAILAEMYGRVGQGEEGLQVLAEAQAEIQESRESWWEALLYCAKGRLFLTSESANPKSAIDNRQIGAEACFRKAIDVARRQSAKSLELRAAIPLARLWQSQGKTGEARLMLADIYGWFTEGFDTADLREAQMLLEEIGETATLTDKHPALSS